MNIIVFSLAYEPFIGGAEIAIREIMTRLPHASFDVITLRFNNSLPERETIGNVTIHRIGFSIKDPTPAQMTAFPLYLNKVVFPVAAALAARKLLRKKRYDFAWAIMSYMSFPAYFLSKLTGLPYAVMLQDGDAIEHITDRWRVRPFRSLLRLAFQGAATIHALSTFLAGFARAMGYTGVVPVIPNGVDVAVFTKEVPENELDALRRALNKKTGSADVPAGRAEEEALIVTTSRLVAKNGVGDLIAAFQFLPPSYKLAVVGEGPDLVSLKSRTSELGLDSRVTFAGRVPNSEILKYLKASDVFVRPSHSEGFGISFIEAMAAKIPVIATPVGGITDFIFDPEANPGTEPTGFYCAPGDPRSIAKTIERVVNDTEGARRVVENAHRLVTEKYGWDLIARRTEEEVFAPIASRKRVS